MVVEARACLVSSTVSTEKQLYPQSPRHLTLKDNANYVNTVLPNVRAILMHCNEYHLVQVIRIVYVIKVDRQTTDDGTHLSTATVRVQSTMNYGYTVYQYKCGQTLRSLMVDFVLEASRD